MSPTDFIITRDGEDVLLPGELPLLHVEPQLAVVRRRRLERDEVSVSEQTFAADDGEVLDAIDLAARHRGDRGADVGETAQLDRVERRGATPPIGVAAVLSREGR